MNKTVEKGKTLLVDGPASVALTSGKAEVFGNAVGSTSRIVIREGKRLPFTVEERRSSAFRWEQTPRLKRLKETPLHSRGSRPSRSF